MKNVLALSLSDIVFITLINVGSLTLMSRMNFVLSCVKMACTEVFSFVLTKTAITL